MAPLNTDKSKEGLLFKTFNCFILVLPIWRNKSVHNRHVFVNLIQISFMYTTAQNKSSGQNILFTPLEVSEEFKDAYNDNDKHILALRQKEYDSQTPSLHYETLQETESHKIKLNKHKLGELRIITRLSLGQYMLNHGLFKMGQHQTGKCYRCNTQETIKHFQFECKHYNLTAQMGKTTNSSGND